MIYKLRKNFIKICMLSFLAVFIALFSAIFLVSSLQTNRSLDLLTDLISENDGKFPDFKRLPPNKERSFAPNDFDAETPFRTRYFIVGFNNNGDVQFVNTQSIVSVNQSQATEYARTALEKGNERGWIKEFRYKVCSTPSGKEVVFVSGTSEKEANRGFLFSVLSVFSGGSLIVLLLITLISKRAVKPAAESYTKQKQFITDANHELKTPLTLIRTNLEIIEAENGSNEWIRDIKDEVSIMTDLVNHLVALARMDEDQEETERIVFDLSGAVDETVDMFSSSISGTGRKLSIAIPEGVSYIGDEGAVRKLVSILMDNAAKYCDEGGVINVTLHGGKHPILTVDNSYAAVENIELARLFDRFYRADKARTYGSGFGVGLSMAKAIVEKHHGSIAAQNLRNGMIRFCVKL